MGHVDDPKPAASVVDFASMLVDAANYLMGSNYIDEAEEIDIGGDVPNDGGAADAVDTDGSRWRVKIDMQSDPIKVTRHRISD
jgi:hypothetical protein